MPEDQQPPKINDVMPGQTIQPSAQVEPPVQSGPVPQAAPPADVDPKNIPTFGELQSKVAAHPLFSGAKEPPAARKGLFRKTLWPVLALVIALVLLYLAVDAGLVKGYSHLPFHFFKAPVAATTPVITPPKKAVSSTSPTDPTSSWTSYSSSDGKISLKYPPNWVMASHPELCSKGVLLLGVSSSSVGVCGSENFGQISITWQPAHASCGDLNSDAWTVSSKETVIVSGVSGVKQIATAKAPASGLGSDPLGTKTINYCFNAGGYTYVADYTQLNSYPDAQSDFDLMVTKTLKFSK